jgi:hypothetical protein
MYWITLLEENKKYNNLCLTPIDHILLESNEVQT